MIQAPQATVEKASTRPMTGDPSSTSREGFVPAQYSIANRIAMNTMALPRSGCLATSNVGTPAMRQGGKSSRSVGGASRRSASQRASMRSEEHTSELQSRLHLVCRLLLEKKKKKK